MTVHTGYVVGLIEQALTTRMNLCHVIVVVIVMFIVVIVHVRQVTVFFVVPKLTASHTGHKDRWFDDFVRSDALVV